VGRVTAGSPAQKAGILPNDIIVKYGGQKVKDRSQINRLIQRSPVGEEVEILISRESELLTLKAKILDSAQVNAVAKTSIVDEQYREVVSRISKIGMEVRELKWIEKKRGDIGVMIHSVTQGSLAASMRLKEGDRVLSTNGHVLHSPEEFYQHILDSEGKLSMVLQRNTSRIRVKFTIQ